VTKLRAWLRRLTNPGVATTLPVLPLWLGNGPAVIWLSDSWRLRNRVRWGDHGYLPVYHDPSLRAWRAVWPLPLWAVHVVGHGGWLLLWGTVGLLWRHGLVRFESRENDVARLRDLRFGREW